MPSDYDNNLLRQAIINIKAKDFSMARHYLELTLEIADDRETRTQANYWMSEICFDLVEKRKYLEEALANEPTHPDARRALAILDGKLSRGEIVNPDQLPIQESGSQAAVADRFACPKCGARMVFDGDGRTLICEHCSRNQVLNQAPPQFEQDFITSMASGRGHRTPVRLKTFNCQGCGAHFIFSALEISAVCVYCGSPHVVAVTRELIEPDSIIPMAFDQRQANLFLTGWLQKNKLHPSGEPPEPQGLYLPVWTFDIFGNIPWHGTVYRDKRQVPVSGDQSVSYDDITIPAVRRLSDLLPKILAGFDTANAAAYDPRYLSGWPAEVYEYSMSDASLDAREKAVERTRSRIHAEKGQVSDLSYSSANLAILSFKLVLIPLWQASYTVDDRNYRVVINGQTGMVFGEMHRQGLIGWLEDVFAE